MIIDGKKYIEVADAPDAAGDVCNECAFVAKSGGTCFEIEPAAIACFGDDCVKRGVHYVLEKTK